MQVQGDQPENNYCKVCGHIDEYYDEDSVAYHNNSPKHIANQILLNYKENKLYFSKNRDGIVVLCSAESKPLDGFTCSKLENIDQHKIRIYAKPNQGVRFTFTIKNDMKDDDFLLVGIQLAHPQPQFVLNDNPYVFGADPHLLEKKSTLKGAVFCEFKAEDIGQYEMPIMFTFHRESIQKNLIIIREMVITVQEGQAVNIFTKSPYTAEDWEKPEQVIRANELMPLTLYKVPKLLKILIPRGLGEQSLEGLNLPPETIGQLNLLLNTTRNVFDEGPTPENYMAYFHHLLWWEEVIGRINLRKYNMSSVTMEKRGPFYALQVPGLAEKRPSLLRGDYLFIRPKANVKIIFEGKIKEMEDSTILISGVNEGLAGYYSPIAEFDVRFLMSRISLERMHEAVSKVFTSNQDSRIFPKPPKKIVKVPSIKKFYNPLIVSNEEQRTAVEHIVAGSSGLAPYIVFGPPGTGKTMTIVEAIVQLVAKNPKNRIMVCTDSNMAADHVALTLLQYNKQLNISNFILRANSRTREWSVMPPALQSVSNGSNYENSYSVSSEYASKFRIFVTTLLHSAKYWPKNGSASTLKITHLFIDEAAQSTESATLVPMTGLLSAGGRLVLAGDPQQLGPVVISREANHRGLGQSLLKRLRTNYENLYTDDPNFITMLVKNFRSDPDILAIPNELFYNDALQARAKPDSLSKVSILGLPGGERAVVFHAINSMEQRMGDAPSFFNEKELEMLKRYTLALITKHNVSLKDIGIIAPYIRQVYKIKHWLSSMNYKDIEVGTVESFQGKEKRVILVSTVRANCRLLDYDAKYGLGFLVDDKRYNVTLTRAKAKLIIIGNPTCLSRDSKWRKYMEFCKQNHCYFGQEMQQLERTADLLTEIARTRFDKCRLTDELKSAKKDKKIAK